jgi:5,6-dimethylbenzimidazole synthase
VTAFDPDFRTKLRELIIWRRDVRRFRAGALPTGTVDRLQRFSPRVFASMILT